MSWLYLSAAIALELTGTISMKLSEGLSKPIPTAVMIASYCACFALIALALREIPVGTAYAIWSGVGTAMIAIAGVMLFQEQLTPLKIVSLLLIIAGVVGLNLGGSKAAPKTSNETSASVIIEPDPPHTYEFFG